MVRNITGGSKHKSQARKNVVPRGASAALRTALDEGECFAQVERMLGGSNCHVMCVDGVLRLCVIRGKFRGKGKRDNVLAMGTLVLVGMRDYESSKTSNSKNKLENCDLLEVYRDTDKARVFSSVKIDWSNLNTTGTSTGTSAGAGAKSSSSEDGQMMDHSTTHEDIVFMTADQLEMERLVEEQEKNIAARAAKTANPGKISAGGSDALFGDDDDVDVDDV